MDEIKLSNIEFPTSMRHEEYTDPELVEVKEHQYDNSINQFEVS